MIEMALGTDVTPTWFHQISLPEGLSRRLTSMPRAYPVQFRQQAITLARSGRSVTQVAYELDIHPVTLHKWIRQDDIDHGRRPGIGVCSSPLS